MALPLSSVLACKRSLLAVFFSFLLTSAVAQDRTTVDGEAQITDPDIECTAYSYPTVLNNLNEFPEVWAGATILSSDTEAQQKYQSISGSIPDIAVKGTAAANGDFSGTTPSYPADDPDCWWTFSGCTQSKHDGVPPDISTVPEPNTLGYGFDDGPNCSHNAFYDHLTENNQKATMFYIGSNVMNWPLEAIRGVRDGHEVCVHTWSHRYMTSLQNEDAFAELWYNEGDQTCRWAPFGDVDDRIRAIAAGLGLQNILWVPDSDDWKVSAGQSTPEQVDANYQSLVNNQAAGKYNNEGVIYLMHELNNYTMSETVAWYDKLKTSFNLVPVGVAYNVTQIYTEPDVIGQTFAEYISNTPASGSGTTAWPTIDSSSTLPSSSSNSGGSSPSSISVPRSSTSVRSGSSSSTTTSSANPSSSSASNNSVVQSTSNDSVNILSRSPLALMSVLYAVFLGLS